MTILNLTLDSVLSSKINAWRNYKRKQTDNYEKTVKGQWVWLERWFRLKPETTSITMAE